MSSNLDAAHKANTLSAQPATPVSLTLPDASPSAAPPAVSAADVVKAGLGEAPSESQTAQTESVTAHMSPVVQEPLPKRPKLQFGRGLASRMSSAAQSDFNLLEAAVATAEVQQAQQPADQEQPQQPAAQAEPQSALRAQEHSPQRIQAELLSRESDSPAAAETSLEELLAQNSPGSLHRSSWVQIRKDLQTLSNHRTRLQVSIARLLLTACTASCDHRSLASQSVCPPDTGPLGLHSTCCKMPFSSYLQATSLLLVMLQLVQSVGL